MKRVVSFLVCIIMVFSLTGCGKETLSCTMQGTTSGMQLNQELEAEFNNNVVTNMNMNLKVYLTDQYKSYASVFEKTLESSYKKYSENGASVNIETKDDIIYIDIIFDVKNMTTKQRENLDMSDIFGTKSATKKALEKQGYTCK